MHKEKNDATGFIPVFQKTFLHPRFWGVWLGAGAIAALAYIPPKFRDPLLAGIGRLAGNLLKAPVVALVLIFFIVCLSYPSLNANTLLTRCLLPQLNR